MTPMDCIPGLVALTVLMGTAFLVGLALAVKEDEPRVWILPLICAVVLAACAAELADELIHGCGA